jgi:hypothetical protein
MDDDLGRLVDDIAHEYAITSGAKTFTAHASPARLCRAAWVPCSPAETRSGRDPDDR